MHNKMFQISNYVRLYADKSDEVKRWKYTEWHSELKFKDTLFYTAIAMRITEYGTDNHTEKSNHTEIPQK